MMIDVLPLRSAAEPLGRGDRLVRNTLFVVTFLLVWVSTTPFADLGNAGQVSSVNDGNVVGQLATLALTAAMIAFIARHQPHVLAKAITPILILTLAWFALSAIFSNYPGLSFRRVILAALTIFQAAVFLLLPPRRDDFGRLLGICALIVLALCYAGVVLLPGLSVHQFSDIREPELAGAWRGVFGHKNGAGAGMILLIFIGLFVIRSWNRWAGILIIVLAGAFLIATQSKSPLQVLPFVLLVVWMTTRLRNPVIAVALLLLVPAAIGVLTIGSVTYEPIRALLDYSISDPTFTGRDVIWIFAMEQTAQRPLLGFGFQAFWGTSELLSAWNPQESWGMRGSDAHNSFLNLSVMTGLVGMALALTWVVGQPLLDYLRGRSNDADPALTTLFIRIWLFSLCLSGFESVYFSGGSSHLVHDRRCDHRSALPERVPTAPVTACSARRRACSRSTITSIRAAEPRCCSSSRTGCSRISAGRSCRSRCSIAKNLPTPWSAYFPDEIEFGDELWAYEQAPARSARDLFAASKAKASCSFCAR